MSINVNGVTITADDCMKQIPWALKGIRQENERLELWVRRARLAGVSWTELGRALGISRQAAQQRFGR